MNQDMTTGLVLILALNSVVFYYIGYYKSKSKIDIENLILRKLTFKQGFLKGVLTERKHSNKIETTFKQDMIMRSLVEPPKELFKYDAEILMVTDTEMEMIK